MYYFDSGKARQHCKVVCLATVLNGRQNGVLCNTCVGSADESIIQYVCRRAQLRHLSVSTYVRTYVDVFQEMYVCIRMYVSMYVCTALDLRYVFCIPTSHSCK